MSNPILKIPRPCLIPFSRGENILRLTLTFIFAFTMCLIFAIPALAIDGDILVGTHPLSEKYRHKREGYYLPLKETVEQFGMEAKLSDKDVIIQRTAHGDLRIPINKREIVIDGNKIDIGGDPILRDGKLFYPITFFERVLDLAVHEGVEDSTIYISRVVNITEVAPDGVGIEYKYDRSYSNFELDDGDVVRLVLDFDAAVIRGGAVAKTEVGEDISNFRLAQFNSKPDIVRLVIELKKRDGVKPQYRIDPKPGGLWIGIGPVPFKVEMENSPDGCSALISGGRYIEYKDSRKNSDDGGILTIEFKGARFPEEDQTLPGVGLVSRTRVFSSEDGVSITFDLLGKPEYSIEELPGHKLRVNFKGAPGDLEGRVIIIDPGHGGRDPGAMRSDIQEKDLNLEMSKYLADELRALGATVFMTRTKDVYLDLDERLDFARRHGADLMVVVHTNASRQPVSEIYGPMLIFDEGCDYRNLLALVYEEMVANGGREGIGPRLDDRGLYILTHRCNLNVLLMEAAFLNNPKDLALLTQPEGTFKRNLIHGVAIGILRYYTGEKPSPGKPKIPPHLDANLFGLIDTEGLLEG